MPDEISVEDLVTFAIMMQNGEGIMTKSPDYIMEKWRSLQIHPGENAGRLDGGHLALMNDWRNYWGKG